MSQNRALSQQLGKSINFNQSSGRNSIDIDSFTQEDSLLINNPVTGRISPFGGPMTNSGKAPRYTTDTASSNLHTLQPAGLH